MVQLFGCWWSQQGYEREQGQHERVRARPAIEKRNENGNQVRSQTEQELQVHSQHERKSPATFQI